VKVTAESNWLRAMGRTLFKMAERPDRQRNNDLYTDLRTLGFMAQAVALLLEDEDSFVLSDEFVNEAITQPEVIRESTLIGVTAPTPTKGL
jgi:hypothetical protein